MGKNNKAKQKEASEPSRSREPDPEELQEPRENFSVKDWDNFYSIRGVDISFEKHAEWPQFQGLLTEYLLFRSAKPKPPKLPAELRILVPGCGNSRLSEHLYDVGFLKITNVDTSRVVIRDMLKRNGIDRPKMKWRLEDMTMMTFSGNTFDAVVDKGAYDTLMAAEHNESFGSHYLNEIKRLLREGGKFICVTILEPHALNLLFLHFRCGWNMSLHTIALEPSSRQIFMVVFEKDSCCTAISDISSFLDDDFVKYHGDQARELNEALDDEKGNRAKHATVTSYNVTYSLDEVKRGIRGDVSVYEPGRRILIHFGIPKLFYNCVLLDAKQDSGYFSLPYCVYLIPKLMEDDWFYATEEGQWLIAESTRAARLLMVFPVSSGGYFLDDIRRDFEKYARQLEPGYTSNPNSFDIQFRIQAPGDACLKRNALRKGVSNLYGSFAVEDLTFQALNHNGLINERTLRRLLFQRANNVVQDEALLSTKGSVFESHLTSSNEMEVDHSYLPSVYHKGIFPGMLLIYKYRNLCYTMKTLSRGVILGVAAGLLPMFMKRQFPSLKIEAFEIDPLILDAARDYFGFKEDERLKAHVGDGIEFVKELADSEAEEKLDFLIVDVRSSNPSSGLNAPHQKYVEESFLLNAKRSLSEQGILVIHLSARSTSVKETVHSRLKKVFSTMFRLKLEADLNEILFLLKAEDPINEPLLSQVRHELAKSPQRLDQWNQRVLDVSKSVELLNLRQCEERDSASTPQEGVSAEAGSRFERNTIFTENRRSRQ